MSEKQDNIELKTIEKKGIDPFYSTKFPEGPERKIFFSPMQLASYVQQYFDAQVVPATSQFGMQMYDKVTGEQIMTTRPYTISGLARHLGVLTNTLRNYESIIAEGCVPDEYSSIILAARQRVEEYAESRLYDVAGSKGGSFVLRSGFGWLEGKEPEEIIRLRVESRIAKERLQMQREKHKLEMELLRMSEDEDSGFNITITRAKRSDDE